MGCVSPGDRRPCPLGELEDLGLAGCDVFVRKLAAMKEAKDLLPWSVADISIRPYEGYWSFNPSIHFDGTTWRCVLRCCDYSMPNGVTVRSKAARPAAQQTKNVMVILDPQSWRPTQVFKMQEKDGLPRETCAHVGFEDMRIFRTDKGGLQGIAASLHLRRNQPRQVEGVSQHQPPEQVLLSFDSNYDIVGAQPIRGDGWSGTPQKNWVPFDHCTEPRFLYSIAKGTMFDDRGAIQGDAASATPSSAAAPLAPVVAAAPRPDEPSAPVESKREEPWREEKKHRSKHVDRRVNIRGGDVRVVRGGRVNVDAMASRPSSRHSSHQPARVVQRSGDNSTRLMGSGRLLGPKYEGLRGGTQLCRVGDDAWLGIGHEMKFVNNKKYYWHTWYLVDSRGVMTAASEPMKLASNGIEFAAGLAIDGNRVVVSFGVDDMESKLGETQLSAVLAALHQVAR